MITQFCTVSNERHLNPVTPAQLKLPRKTLDLGPKIETVLGEKILFLYTNNICIYIRSQMERHVQQFVLSATRLSDTASSDSANDTNSSQRLQVNKKQLVNPDSVGAN